MSDIENQLDLQDVKKIYRNLSVDTLIEHAVNNEGASIS
jgi:phosphoenolpyruvate carboxykinase (ATP)